MPLKKLTYMAAAAAIGLLTSGCDGGGFGFDGVQLNGKIFDAIGVNTSSVKKTPKMAARPGIVVPPDLAALPEPGTGSAPAPEVAGVQDYDAKRSTSREDLEKQQAAYCKTHYDDAVVHGDQDAALAQGPLGSCQKSVLSIFKSNDDSEQ